MTTNPKPYSVTYDDGTKSPLILLKSRGDEEEYHMVWEETLDGYTVKPSSKKGGKYIYVDVDKKSGELIDTELVAGKYDPSKAGICKEAATTSDRMTKGKNRSYRERNKDSRKLRGGPILKEGETVVQEHRRTVITTGTMKNLVVPIRFADHTTRPLPSRSDLDTLMNNNGPDALCPTGSVREFYRKNSFGQFNLDSTVVDWVTIDYTEKQCADENAGDSDMMDTCLKNALDKAVAAGVNFQDYDVDNNGVIDGMTFFHSGYAAEWGGTDGYGTFYSNRIW